MIDPVTLIISIGACVVAFLSHVKRSSCLGSCFKVELETKDGDSVKVDEFTKLLQKNKTDNKDDKLDEEH